MYHLSRRYNKDDLNDYNFDWLKHFMDVNVTFSLSIGVPYD